MLKKASRTEYMRNRRQKLIQQGFKHFAVLAPEDIVEKVKAYKNKLMKQWWKEHLEKLNNA